MKRIGMMKIKDILRHRHDFELPRAQIAVGVSTETVSHMLARAEEAGLSWPLPSGLDDEALRARLYPAPDQDSDRTQPDRDAIVEALTASHSVRLPVSARSAVTTRRVSLPSVTAAGSRASVSTGNSVVSITVTAPEGSVSKTAE